jgi:hypothetical protein
MSFNPAEYATVAERLVEFWKDCPRGRIMTFMEVDDGNRVLMRGELYADIADTVPTTTGWAEEIRGSSMVNKTSAVENCETSLCGRLLANYMYQGSKNRASLEEIVKVYRQGGEINTSGPTTSTNSDEPSPKQLGLIRSLGWNGDKPVTKREASQLIEKLKAESQAEADF